MRKLRTLSCREREVMDIVFRMRCATAGEVRKRLADPPSYSAVRSTLRILERKGFLQHADAGRRYVYRPTIERDAAARNAVEHLMKTFFGGSAIKAVAALLERPDLDVSPRELHRLAQRIRRARRKGR